MASKGAVDAAFTLVRMDAIRNPKLVHRFMESGAHLDEVRTTGLAPFVDPYKGLPADHVAAKRAVIDYLKAEQFVPPIEATTKYLHTFHGCSPSVLESIMEKGFIALHTLDGGYFGKGTYR